MSGHSFRFIHAADFHLEDALRGLDEVPEHLKTSLIEAPHSAVRRVFDAAISERVDFVILSGDLIDFDASGPRAISFLLEQFERLGERDISVYWATSSIESVNQWKEWMALPANVHLFSHERVEELSHFRNEYTIATVHGRSGSGKLRGGSGDYQGDTDGPFQIAVANGDADSDALAHRNIDYWALGGNSQHTTLMTTPCRVEYPGSPQGRSLAEAGPHGCVLVHVEMDGDVRTQLLTTEAVRWRHETLSAGDATTRDQLHRILRSRMQELVNQGAQQPTLVCWTISEDTHNPMLHSGLGEELTGWLREQFGYGSPAAWTVRVDVQPPVNMPEEWYEEDTILGDYLRVTRDAIGKSSSVDLTHFASPQYRTGELESAMRISSTAGKSRLLGEAAMLGVDLLRGDLTVHALEHGSRSGKEDIPT
jgi:exonuclease SbcD